MALAPISIAEILDVYLYRPKATFDTWAKWRGLSGEIIALLDGIRAPVLSPDGFPIGRVDIHETAPDPTLARSQAWADSDDAAEVAMAGPLGESRVKGNRKDYPLARGLFDFFPDALLAIANNAVSAAAQHDHGSEIYWERGKSQDHADCLLRHFVDRGVVDTDGVRHSTKMAWRALALLQLELEKANDLSPSPGAR